MPKYHESYETFNQLPAWTRPVWVEDGRRVENNADPYKWSGDNDPPAVGAKVKVYMNRFGRGVVTGYFAEHGWLGVLVKLNRPPLWWRKQTRERGENPAVTPGHFFGLDLEPRTNKPTSPS